MKTVERLLKIYLYVNVHTVANKPILIKTPSGKETK